MVKFLKYKNEDIPIRVSYYALKMLKEKMGKSLTTLADDDFEAWEILLFYGLESGYRAMDKPFPYTPADSVDIADELFFEFMAVLPQFFPQLEKFAVIPGKEGVPDIEKKLKKSISTS